MATASQLNQSLEPKRTEECAICKKTGYLTADGWHTDYEVEAGEEGAFVAGHGEYLLDAEDVGEEWTCSRACRSQAMYQNASNSDKATLRKVLDACRVLSEYAVDANRIVREGMDDDPYTSLASESRIFLEAICADDDPEWTNCKTREEELQHAIGRARLDLEIAADLASVPAKCAMLTDNPTVWNDYETRVYAKNAASFARVALDLKSAEEGSDETL